MGNEKPRLKFIKPMAPRLVMEAPVSDDWFDDWFHETKYDSFRTQLIRDWQVCAPSPARPRLVEALLAGG
ncbi:hypothetical protein NKI94_13875 [Mesorhizobium australicum]|uniref:hypothetical protein n=1 Tax=Mesorhizobium australicum TaxID=536018 RepID=UPI003337E33A